MNKETFDKLIEIQAQKRMDSNLELVSEMKAAHRKTKFWLNMSRTICLVTVGILGFGTYKINSQVEDMVAEQVRKLDTLPIAISHGENGDWDNAFVLLDRMWDEMQRGDSIDSPDFKNQFFNNALWVLATHPNPDGKFSQGLKTLWEEISKHNDYLTYLENHEGDPNTEYNVVITTMKFAYEVNANSTYLRSLKNAYDYSQASRDYKVSADYAYVYAMVSLIAGYPEKAKEYMILAHDINPDEYRLQDWSDYKNSYFNDNSYLFFEYLASRNKVNDLKVRHENVVKLALERLSK